MNKDNNENSKPKFEIVDKRFSRDEIDNEIEQEKDNPTSSNTIAEQVDIPSDPVSNVDNLDKTSKTEFEFVPSPSTNDLPDLDATTDISEESPDEFEDDPEMQEAMLSQLDIDLILQNTMGVAIQLAFVYLGLQPDPKTKLINQNIGKASRAINFVDFCIQIYNQSFDSKTRNELARVLQMLKMQFVQLTQPLNPEGGPNIPN